MKRLALLALLPGCFLFHHKQSASCQEGRTVDLGLPEDVKKLAGCERATGIRIRTGAAIDVTPLSGLEEITGDLSIGPTVDVDTVAFNGLVRVGGTILVEDNGSLRGLFLPRLEQAGRIDISNNAVLSTISLPRLGTVQGSFVVTDNTSLEMITATALTDIGQELVISGHPQLDLLEMPRIAHMQTIRLESNPKLPADLAEQLTNKADVSTSVVPPNLVPQDAKAAGSAVAGSGSATGRGSASGSAAPP